ncbi:GDSL esterase/lipase At5g03810 [Physcomitrium patens]|uniref:Uncharacterized protein n=1 Tax=Physcomitrium patens TaxID=3218 RepID=A0A2K1JLB6_PHYPA|nr:GDSL esterase/lipase At5g03810-like [Physcomitrium patens]PNR42344.1 hypothetical protein PHYPA_017173 [Physcomitrium patens]|eukprot:XP_024392320.1 GDSL esterase/lipase At5g03810-like [Physcomitrella patens]
MAKFFGAAIAISSLILFIGTVGILGMGRDHFMNSSKSVDYRDYITGVVIFGDSTVDVGNNNYLLTVVKSNFEPYGTKFEGGGAAGRFCDGQIAIDFITRKIGYPLPLPYLAPNAHGKAILTGINFASSASGWYDKTAEAFNVKGLTEQLLWYKNWKNEVVSLAGQEEGNHIISNALYVFSTGSNDWINNYYLSDDLMEQYTPETYTTFLISLARYHIQELYDLGGRNIAVLGLPPLGCLPSQITLNGKGNPGCVEDFNIVAKDFNDQLRALVAELKQTFRKGRVGYLDTYTILDKIVHNPESYGISETRIGCCGIGTIETAILCNKASVGTCPDAFPYVWWDSFHPTDHVYSLIAVDLFNQALPVFDGSTPQP